MTLKEIQSALISLGYKLGKVDGIIGIKTVKAVKAFQKAAKVLKIDGIPGPMTLRALERALQPLYPTGPSQPTQPPKPAVEPPVASEQTVNKPDPVRNAPQWAIALYESLGWSHIQAVALTANLMWESGGNRFNTIHFDTKGGGAGQWIDSRFKDLTYFATRRNKKWNDPETQLLFLDWELHNTERRAGILLKACETIEEAIAACIKIWRPGIPHTDKRLAIARKLLGG
jgi:peptidoglycan hydrolase-like protein with peptidoglycan-binding domain